MGDKSLKNKEKTAKKAVKGKEKQVKKTGKLSLKVRTSKINDQPLWG